MATSNRQDAAALGSEDVCKEIWFRCKLHKHAFPSCDDRGISPRVVPGIRHDDDHHWMSAHGNPRDFGTSTATFETSTQVGPERAGKEEKEASDTLIWGRAEGRKKSIPRSISKRTRSPPSRETINSSRSSRRRARIEGDGVGRGPEDLGGEKRKFKVKKSSKRRRKIEGRRRV
jgi:hypothetical protein